MKKLMLLMQLANLLLIGVSSEDTLCQYSGRQWQNNIIDYNDVLEYDTIHPYKDWMVCSGAYKLGPNCAGAVVSCEEFSTVASKGCRWGDYMSIIEKDTGSYERFCRNKGPSNYKPKGDFKLRFVSNGRKTAYGVSCQITCPEPIVPPVDCTLSEWGPWTSCSQTCGDGTQTRSKEIVEAFGGSCSEELDDFQDCSNEQPCPVDCVTTQWDTWSSCSKTCGGGIMDRQRSVDIPAAHGGEQCGDLTEEEACNTEACPGDCGSEWYKYAVSGKCILSIVDVNYENVHLNYTEAKSRCAAEGAHLISILSEKEFNFLSGKGTWLGTEYKGSNTYAWSDGSLWSYETWKAGHPAPTQGECVAFSEDGFFSTECDSNLMLSVICEKDPQ